MMTGPITEASRVSSARLEGTWGDALRQRFELAGPPPPGAPFGFEDFKLAGEILDALEAGLLRIAEPAPNEDWSDWIVHSWIRRALITLCAVGPVAQQPGALSGTEVATLGWIEQRSLDSRIPVGSFLRRGCFVAPGSHIMPPSTVQVGAYLASGVRVDSHVLVGSCAQIGEGVVLGCGSMIGGVLMPEEAPPVILERGVILGGNCGIYGSVWVGEETVLRSGTIIQATEGVFDAVNDEWLLAAPGHALKIPAYAEVAMGVPPLAHCAEGMQRLTAMIVKREMHT